MEAQKRAQLYKKRLSRIAWNFYKEYGIPRNKRTEKIVRIFTNTLVEAMRNTKTSEEYVRSLEIAKRKFLRRLRKL